MSPEDLLIQLKSTSSQRMNKSLDAIYQVCKSQVNFRTNDFSFSTISRIGYKKGVPRAQSIRNKTGEPYRALIKSFADASIDDKPKSTLRSNRPKDAWISEIKDPKLKLLVQIQSSQLQEAQTTIKEFTPPNMNIHVFDKQVGVAEIRLTKHERQALEYLKSEHFLNHWNFKKGPRGEIIDSKGNKVFMIGTIDALDKTLEFL